MIKKIVGIFVWIALVLSSCSKTDYVDAIPKNSHTLIAIDATRQDGLDLKPLLQDWLRTKDVAQCGIDFSSKIYLFVTNDGNMGLCARVSDADRLRQTLDSLVQRGFCTKSRTRREAEFYVAGSLWAVGFSSEAVLVAGPVPALSQSDLQRRMAGWLETDDGRSIKDTPLFGQLDTINAPIALAARLSALPPSIAQPYRLGLSESLDPSQLLLTATLRTRGDVLSVESRLCGTDENAAKVLQSAPSLYRPIGKEAPARMPNRALMGLFVNVRGATLHSALRRHRELSALMMGLDATTGIDSLLMRTDGDLLFLLPAWQKKGVNLSVKAITKSTPSVVDPLPEAVQTEIWGKRLAVVVRLPNIPADPGSAFGFFHFLKPVLGHTQTIVYSIR